MTSTPLTELDFAQIKDSLKTFLQSQTQFADYDYDGSNMSVILDVLAYNTFMNNFYTNMAYSEMFLDSAQLRSSIVSRAKELNYLPRSYRSSTTTISLSFSPNDDPGFITIPKYTKFVGTIDGASYTFSTNQVYTVVPNNGVYSLSDIEIYEGRVEKEYFEVDSGTKFILSNSKLDTNSIAVKVYESTSATASSDEYTYKQNLFDVGSSDKVFYLQPAEVDKYELHFGLDVFGRSPQVGEVVEVTYRITNGELPNGIAEFTAASTISGYTSTVTTISAASGGAEQESLESIKFYAPKSIQIQNRAVTESDYINLLKNEFSEIQSVSVYGGEELDPPKYGRVIVAVDVRNSDGVSESNKDKYSKFLKDRSPLSIDPLVVSPEFMYIALITTVYYNTNTSDLTDGSVSTLIRNTVSAYSNTNLNDFGKNVRISRLSRAIDDADPAIISNDSELHMIIDINPELDVVQSYSLNFNNELNIDHPLESGEDITIHHPAIKSTNFTYNNTTAYIQDNGEGILEIITNEGVGGFVVLNNNIGTVDYDTGKVNIRNLSVSNFSGSAIKIHANPHTQDVIGPKDRIISIRDIDVQLTVKAATK